MNTSTQGNHGWWSKQIGIWDSRPAWRDSEPSAEAFHTRCYDPMTLTEVEDPALARRKAKLMAKLRRGPGGGGDSSTAAAPRTEQKAARASRAVRGINESGVDESAPGFAEEVAVLLEQSGWGAPKPRTRLMRQRERRIALPSVASDEAKFDLTVPYRRSQTADPTNAGGSRSRRNRPASRRRVSAHRPQQPNDEFLRSEVDFMFAHTNNMYQAVSSQHKYRN